MTDPQWILHGPGKHDRAVCDTAETWARLFRLMWRDVRYRRCEDEDEQREHREEKQYLLRVNIGAASNLTLGNTPAELVYDIADAFKEMDRETDNA